MIRSDDPPTEELVCAMCGVDPSDCRCMECPRCKEVGNPRCDINTWTMFTKRTNDPKLTALEELLNEQGIPSRRHGESWHAPILQVPEGYLGMAWEILIPIDDIPDDDPVWSTK